MNSSKENLKNTKWGCKYHVVFIPKYRKKSIYGWIRKRLGPIIREVARQKESVVEGGALYGSCACVVVDSSKVLVFEVVGYIEGKSAIAIARRFMDRAKNFVGENFWARRVLRID